MLTKHTFVINVLNAKPKACWEGADQDVQVKEERDPGGGLMLRHGCYDGNVDLSIAMENVAKDKNQIAQEKYLLDKQMGKNLALYSTLY